MNALSPLTHARPPSTLAGEQPGPGRRRRHLWVIVLVIVGLTLLGWAVQLSTSSRLDDGSADPGSGITNAGSAADPRALPGAGTANGNGAGSGRNPANSAATHPDLTWQDFAGLSLPVSTTSGPRCQPAGRAACFAHTDAGAALAAVHLLVRTFPFAGSDVFGPTIRDQVTGPDAATLARLTQDAYTQLVPAAGVTDGAPIHSEGGWIAGYRLDPATAPGSDTDHRAVRVLLRQSGEGDVSAFTEFAVHLVWRASDWALIAPAWGDWRSVARAIGIADPALYASYDALGGH